MRQDAFLRVCWRRIAGEEGNLARQAAVTATAEARRLPAVQDEGHDVGEGVAMVGNAHKVNEGVGYGD